jgi:transposase
MKLTFTDNEIKTIIDLYTKDGLNTTKIGFKLGISKTPISRGLKDNGLLRKGNSNGVKISLTHEQEDKIKDMYLNGYNSSEKIAKEVGLSKSYIDNFLAKNNITRTKSEATTLAKTGVKLSEKTKYNMSLAQQKLAKSGKRKQTGGICKNFIINGLKCQGTYEKFYIEKLINDGVNLPKEGQPVITPYGVYYPDFSFEDKLIEIKSDYTYDVLIGLKVNRFTKKVDTNQYEKIKWVNENVKSVEILIVDKRNNNITKK